MDKDQREKIVATLQSSSLKNAVQHIKPAATWNRLSFPPALGSRLRNICSDYSPGQGFICLFAGDGGAGKTLAAEVIAGELHKDLLRVDLSAVESKYIGETEKNLQLVFDAAEQAGAVLFFDEADALFGKRSEVKDSHDRYANIEVSYLLQRIEAFAGLTILAINKKHVDDAEFRRKARYIVDFPGLKSERICR